jgi:hypothetical protein
MAFPINADWTATTSDGDFTASLDMAPPDDISSGDILYIIVGDDDNTNADQFSINDTNFPGWTKEGEEGDNSIDCHIAIFTKEATGSESNITVDQLSTQEMQGIYGRITGGNPDDIRISFASDSASPWLISNPTLTTNDWLLIAAMSMDGGDAGTITVSGTDWSKITQVNSGEFGGDNVGAYAKVTTSTGTPDDCTFTTGLNDDGVVLCMLCIVTADDGSRSGSITQTLPSLSQTVTGEYIPYDVSGSIDQILPSLTQTVSGEIYNLNDRSGSIIQTLPTIIQLATATFDSGNVIAVIDQTLPQLIQAVSGTFLKTYSVSIDQTLPVAIQTVNGTFLKIYLGSIDQTLSNLTQTVSGTFAPGTSTGTIVQTLLTPIQSVTGTFAPGFSVGSIIQTLSVPVQTLIGVFAPGISTATINQILPNLIQTLTGTHLKTHTCVIDQTLSIFVQSITSTFLKTYLVSITQQLPNLNQIATGTFLKTYSASLNQILPNPIQILNGTFLRAHTGPIEQQLPALTQTLTGTHLKTYSVSLNQILPTLIQTLIGTFGPGSVIGSINQILPFLIQSMHYSKEEEQKSLIWTDHSNNLIWVDFDEFILYSVTQKRTIP